MTMQAVIKPDADEVRDNGVFEVLMNTLARPGKILSLQSGSSTIQSMQEIALALVDIEVSYHSDNADLGGFVALTGALNTTAEEADFLFVSGDVLAAAKAAKTGEALYPDAGATIIMQAKLEGGNALTLRGAGIESTTIIAPQIEPEFWALRQKRCSYPSGFDLFLVDGANVLGLPRSTKIEVQ